MLEVVEMPNVGLETVDWDCVNKKADACYTASPKLKIVNLSNNKLSGPAPDLTTFCQLEMLDLSHNKFSGSFPTFSHSTPVSHSTPLTAGLLQQALKRQLQQQRALWQYRVRRAQKAQVPRPPGQ